MEPISIIILTTKLDMKLILNIIVVFRNRHRCGLETLISLAWSSILDHDRQLKRICIKNEKSRRSSFTHSWIAKFIDFLQKVSIKMFQLYFYLTKSKFSQIFSNNNSL